MLPKQFTLPMEGRKKDACCDSCETGGSCQKKFQHKGHGYVSLSEAMDNVKQYSYKQFPYNSYITNSIAGTSIFNESILSINTNTVGCSWMQLILGQSITDSNFVEFKPVDGALPRSNIFTLGNSADASVFNGTVPVGDNTGIDLTLPLTGANAPTIKGLNSAKIPTSSTNAIRPGPIKIRIEYTGSWENNGGTLYVGLSYDFVKDGGVTTNYNSLLPSLGYSTTTSVLNSKFSKSCAITTPVDVYYIPADNSDYEYSRPEGGRDNIIQRLTILVTGAQEAKTNLLRVSMQSAYDSIPSIEQARFNPGGNSIYSSKEEMEEAVERYKERIYFSSNTDYGIKARLGLK